VSRTGTRYGEVSSSYHIRTGELVGNGCQPEDLAGNGLTSTEVTVETGEVNICTYGTIVCVYDIVSFFVQCGLAIAH
jgi:hypothetical protein